MDFDRVGPGTKIWRGFADTSFVSVVAKVNASIVA
jgi:hypothetical protein